MNWKKADIEKWVESNREKVDEIRAKTESADTVAESLGQKIDELGGDSQLLVETGLWLKERLLNLGASADALERSMGICGEMSIDMSPYDAALKVANTYALTGAPPKYTCRLDTEDGMFGGSTDKSGIKPASTIVRSLADGGHDDHIDGGAYYFTSVLTHEGDPIGILQVFDYTFNKAIMQSADILLTELGEDAKYQAKTWQLGPGEKEAFDCNRLVKHGEATELGY